ncbi:MAG: NUDIX hydrolase [Nanoarchaeota archaeon]
MVHLPLNVAISAVVKNNMIQLIQRDKGDYKGLLGLAGGKVEKDEHLLNSAKRENVEETGVECNFEKYLGVVSEHLIENKKIKEHFILHVFLLTPAKSNKTGTPELKTCWVELNRIEEIKDRIIPSDYLIIKKMIKKNNITKNNKKYFECVLEKINENYVLKKFE